MAKADKDKKKEKRQKQDEAEQQPAEGKAKAKASGGGRARASSPVPPRLKAHYRERVAPALRKEFNYPGPMAVPKIAMVKLNMGLGESSQNPRLLDPALKELAAISGQKPIVTLAKKSVAQFKVRRGMSIGCCVTLRGDRMYEFLDRLISIALPRVRDFRGISSKSFDGRGNYTLGVREHTVFPEVDYSKVDKVKGMNVTIVTTAKSDPEALSLLRQMGLPFAS